VDVEPPLPSDRLTIATWNVNSIKVRADAVLTWLKETQCDILLMQEIKCIDENFPTDRFVEAGYEVHVHGQKTYNGVAIASRVPLTLRQKGLPFEDGDIPDEQARYLEVEHGNVIIGCLYLPNGNPVYDDDGLSQKFRYKLNWMQRLSRHAKTLEQLGQPVILAGDYNIIPAAEDCYDINSWQGDALHHPESLKAWRSLIYTGLTDAFRAHHTGRIAFSFWDYQGGAWQKDHGIRIDHMLVNAEAADRLIATDIDKNPRGMERASDHTPLWCQFLISETADQISA
jgi:exodeoxyribonuclease-3